MGQVTNSGVSWSEGEKQGDWQVWGREGGAARQPIPFLKTTCSLPHILQEQRLRSLYLGLMEWEGQDPARERGPHGSVGTSLLV